ncbi:uncharacterized protein KY384_002392 [Bacidia gigantensis]|uniref:uncharacterized protein n=1 Tax=Bacidia gigantensis TaxID=2732470 RepID=UPI001D04B4A0|nr:uncharacterized protein KY384_002392 [Bacidia gigantensis]KAG8532515.1 hypothetical protein KY384_002392 [Bacidia gigantensis]
MVNASEERFPLPEHPNYILQYRSITLNPDDPIRILDPTHLSNACDDAYATINVLIHIHGPQWPFRKNGTAPDRPNEEGIFKSNLIKIEFEELLDTPTTLEVAQWVLVGMKEAVELRGYVQEAAITVTRVSAPWGLPQLITLVNMVGEDTVIPGGGEGGEGQAARVVENA